MNHIKNFNMKKLLLLLLFIPLVSFGQDVSINEYYDDGKKDNRENLARWKAIKNIS